MVEMTEAQYWRIYYGLELREFTLRELELIDNYISKNTFEWDTLIGWIECRPLPLPRPARLKAKDYNSLSSLG
jgi:hypothetical protein